jgi:hypothetical protein
MRGEATVDGPSLKKSISRQAGRVGIAALALLCVGCTPDLKETVGPRVPVPNVTGRVVRGGLPVLDIEVELEDTATDTTVADERTDTDGRFAFAEVGPGTWTVQVKSDDPDDFARVKFEFAFTSVDTMLDVPTMDISRNGLALVQPEDGDSTVVPDLFNPITFMWDWPEDQAAPRFQVRLYVLDGGPFWFSQKIRETSIRWNGLGNQEMSQGEFAQLGAHWWRLRIEDESDLEYDTESRFVTFE